MINRPGPGSSELGWFHRYPARFSSDVVYSLLQDVRRVLGETPVICDPFSGTGSVLAAARQLGMRSVGVELSELGVLISRNRLVPPSDPDALVTLVRSWTDLTAGSVKGVPRELVGWIGVRNARRLAQWLIELSAVKDQSNAGFLTLAISASIRPSSRWLPGSIKPQVDAERTPPPIEVNLLRAAKQLKRDCLLEAPGSTAPSAAVIKGDACHLPMEDASVDAVVTSPPYFTMYDYFDVQRLSYLAFGWSKETALQVGRKHRISTDGVGFFPPDSVRPWYEEVFRGEETFLGRALREYVGQIRLAASEWLRVLREGGIVRLAVADSYRNATTFPLTDLFGEIMQEVGFQEVTTKARQGSHRRILPAGRDPNTGKFSASHSPTVTERIISSRKP